MTADGEARARGAIRTRVEEKLRPLTLPNFLTLLRMALVPFLALAVTELDFRLALWIFVVAGVTDGLDGLLARRLSLRSRLGAYLDPIADKLLLTVAFIVLTIPQGQDVVIPLWLTILALFRDFVIMLVAGVLYIVEDVREFSPSSLGKVTTVMHVVTIGVVLLANVVPLASWIPEACFYTSFGLVILSAFDYIYRISRRVEEARQARHAARSKDAGTSER